MPRYAPLTGRLLKPRAKKPRPAKRRRLSKGVENTIKAIRKLNADSKLDLYPILQLPDCKVGLLASTKLPPKMLRIKPPQYVIDETYKMLRDPQDAAFKITVHAFQYEMSKDKAIHDILLGVKWVLYWEAKRKAFEPSNVQFMNPRAYLAPFMQTPRKAIFQVKEAT
jgi:hypothetical protein